MTDIRLFDRHREKVQPEWIDYNGHMNVAYYVLAFDHATDTFFESVGVDDRYRAETGCSIFVGETHVNYFREVHEGDPLGITTQVIDMDDRRIHLCHRMYHATEGYLSAGTELIVVHVDLNNRRSTAWTSRPLQGLEALFSRHRDIAIPEFAGRRMGIRRG